MLGKADQIKDMVSQCWSNYFHQNYKFEEKILFPKYSGCNFAHLMPSIWLEFILKSVINVLKWLTMHALWFENYIASLDSLKYNCL